MTIKYIKSLLDNKFIYTNTNSNTNTTNKNILLSPYNGITDTEEDYYNHLNNILKPNVYLIKHNKKTNILLIDKYIYPINKNQLIILKRLINFFNKTENQQIEYILKNIHLSNIHLSNIALSDLDTFYKKILIDPEINLNLMNQLLSMNKNCSKPYNNKCNLLFLFFIIDTLIKLYDLIPISYHYKLNQIINDITHFDFISAKINIFNLCIDFKIDKQSITNFINQLVFAINKIHKLKYN
jgi:hypothetical protein